MKKVSLLEGKRQLAARGRLMKRRKAGARIVGDIMSPSGDTWNAELPGLPIASTARTKNSTK